MTTLTMPLTLTLTIDDVQLFMIVIDYSLRKLLESQGCPVFCNTIPVCHCQKMSPWTVIKCIEQCPLWKIFWLIQSVLSQMVLGWMAELSFALSSSLWFCNEIPRMPISRTFPPVDSSNVDLQLMRGNICCTCIDFHVNNSNIFFANRKDIQTCFLLWE